MPDTVLSLATAILLLPLTKVLLPNNTIFVPEIPAVLETHISLEPRTSISLPNNKPEVILPLLYDPKLTYNIPDKLLFAPKTL